MKLHSLNQKICRRIRLSNSYYALVEEIEPGPEKQCDQEEPDEAEEAKPM
jgi:hypothetical protein